MVEFEWDDVNCLATLEHQGVNFIMVPMLFDGRPAMTTESSRAGEVRFATTVFQDDRFYTVVWTPRDERIRIISIRRAWRAEERAYRALHGGRA